MLCTVHLFAKEWTLDTGYATNRESANSYDYSAIANPQISLMCQSANRKFANFLGLIRKSKIRKFFFVPVRQSQNPHTFHHREDETLLGGLRRLSQRVCAHGAQINFGELTPYLSYGRDLLNSSPP